jgi:hypothetical protein
MDCDGLRRTTTEPPISRWGVQRRKVGGGGRGEDSGDGHHQPHPQARTRTGPNTGALSTRRSPAHVTEEKSLCAWERPEGALRAVFARFKAPIAHRSRIANPAANSNRRLQIIRGRPASCSL